MTLADRLRRHAARVLIGRADANDYRALLAEAELVEKLIGSTQAYMDAAMLPPEHRIVTAKFYSAVAAIIDMEDFTAVAVNIGMDDPKRSGNP